MTTIKKTPKDKTVLVLEDERPLQNAIKTKLELSGFEVVTARSAEQALGYLADIPKVDILWVDHYLMGRESGLDFLIKVKKNPRWKRMPVFIVSNTASPDKKNAYLELGINEYFIKAEHRLDDIITAMMKYI